ncbi:MAG TPA: ATP synthase subunit I [Acidobacteriota bacterium]|nr:ATP synthase subunit I [Acidobacteriota bacterium]
MARENQGPPEERILRRVPFEIIVISALLAVGAALLFDLPTGLVFFAGGALAALTFAWLRQSVTRLLAGGRKGALRSGIALYAIRLALICAAFFLIILVYPKKILAFGAGFSVVVLVSLVEGIRALLLLRTWKA